MLILHNAVIHTMDPQSPRASALVIDNARIQAVGEDSAILAEYAPASRRRATIIQDLSGGVIIPGLIDAHIHLEQYALGQNKVDCETVSRQECLRRVAIHVKRAGPAEWILGHGWNQNHWPEGFGNASDLDAISGDHPVYLTAKSLHAAWVNRAALRLAGIHHRTPDPPGGVIQRDIHGEPTGILFESAMQLVARLVPEPQPEQVAQAIQQAQPLLWRMGITSVHDFDQRRCFVALQELHDTSRLRLRVVKSIPLDDLDHAIALGLRSGFGDEFLRIGAVKVFADGALGPRTAAMLAPYQEDEQNQGLLFLDAEELYEIGRRAVSNGLSLAVHAIGDRANHEVLDAFEQIRRFERKSRLRLQRHRVEHVQLIHPEDAPRLAGLSLIASMQPIHATSDMLMADRYWGARAAYSYAWRIQSEHGAKLAFGSDAPVESPNPFWGLHAAVTRRRLDGSPGPSGWFPSQRLTVQQGLMAYTSGAAYAAGLEQTCGKLIPGYLADLALLDTDPFTCDPDQIKDIQPQGTMVGGEWVFQC